jgi:hypothetical protein
MSLDHFEPYPVRQHSVLFEALSIARTIAAWSGLGQRRGHARSFARATTPLALCAGLLAAQPGLAGHDRERETRLRAEIVDLILDGHSLDLRTPEGEAFLAIETPAQAQPARGTVLILHGRGLHPDEGHVVHPLRVGLAAQGWNTLAIQLPVLDKAARYYDYLALFPAAAGRIASAVDHIRDSGGGPLVLLAHSCGAHMAQHWLVHGGGGARATVDAYVGIGMGATDYGQPMREPFGLEHLEVPVLDLYGELDFPAVRRLAVQRLEQIRDAGHPLSAQQVMPGAGHYHEERADALVDAVLAWLDRLSPPGGGSR